jgi:hypothetical protein
MSKHTIISTRLAAGLVICAAAGPPAAQAKVDLGDPAPHAGVPLAQVSTPATVASPSSGFQWGDAGIGAAGTVVLLGGGLVASGAARRRRTQRTIAG